MEDRAKGFSLRQKKSKRIAISGPKPLAAPLTGTPPQKSVSSSNASPGRTRREQPDPSPRPRQNGDTADLVKRRYSTRFNQLPDFGKADPPPMPAMPPVPRQSSAKQAPVFSSRNAPQGPPLPAAPIAFDPTALKRDNFQAEEFAAKQLNDASDEQLREYQATLQKLKHRASTDLQQNVLQNRTQFIKISKEADKLKGEMRNLRSLMSELAVVVNVASVSAGIPEVKIPIDEESRSRARKQANRSSVANMQAMWSTQLHTLWKSVEGSQKYLPAIPGRHIVLEQSGWLELDAATWKSRRHAHLFLLNDHFMVATVKKRRVDPNAGMQDLEKSRTHIVADRCWPLQELELIDLAGTNALTSRDASLMVNAISIRCGSESFTYRSDKSSNAGKTKMMQEFHRTADELKRTLQLGTQEHRKSSINHSSRVKTEVESETSAQDMLIEVDGKHQNMQWVEAQMDDLDSHTALRNFEEAVKQVEKLRRLAVGLEGRPSAHETISTKVEERVTKLAKTISEHLTNNHAKMNLCQQDIGFLLRLSCDSLARSTYLDARKAVIETRIRSVVFEGDLRRHAFQLSYVYFTLMRNTVKTFQQCFPTPTMSACVRWCKDRLDELNNLLSRQLSSVHTNSPTWRDCVDMAIEHAGMMDEVGMDFRNLVKIERPMPNGSS